MVNLSQLLQPLIAATLEDIKVNEDIARRNNPCLSLDKALVLCLKDTASLDRRARNECIMCPIAGTQNSRATTCKGFEAEGLCENTEECKQKDCPTVCWNEFDTWFKCKLERIECAGMCGDELEWLEDELLSIA